MSGKLNADLGYHTPGTWTVRLVERAQTSTEDDGSEIKTSIGDIVTLCLGVNNMC